MSVLGQLSPEAFLNDYWHKKPLLVRNAYPNFECPIDANDLAGLAGEEDVEARIVIEHGDSPWQLKHGPFFEDDFANLPASHWTLLVQAVDHWLPEVKELLKDFRFAPLWRLDDVMISYAPTGGSVGRRRAARAPSQGRRRRARQHPLQVEHQSRTQAEHARHAGRRVAGHVVATTDEVIFVPNGGEDGW